MPPSWLVLLSPLPAHAIVETKPVASAEQIAQGTAGPIAGWQNVTVNLSEPDFGLRHVLVTLDASGRVLSAADHVMFVRGTTADGGEVLISDHESIGGRYEDDGSFRGTMWKTRIERTSAADEDGQTTSSRSEPSPADVDALARIVDDVMRRRAGGT